MKKNRRIFSFILTVSIVAALFINPCSISAEGTKKNTNIVALLKDLGIYAKWDNMDYENETIMREEMASILSVFFGQEEENIPVNTSIYDVPEYWASGHIQTAINNGIMSCYEDGLFRPKLMVTVEQAVTALVRLTGYEYLAVAKGGYPNGYFVVATDIGITKGVKTQNRQEFVTKGVFNELLYNALSVSVMEVSSAKTDRIKYSATDDKSFLSERMNIYKTKGMVIATPTASLNYNDGCGENRVCVDDVIYTCYLDSYPYLGKKVEVYYRLERNDNDGEVLSFIELEQDKGVISVDGRDIVSATDNVFTYEENGKIRTVSIADDLMVIFNGKRMTYFTPKHITPGQGEVRLVDLDGMGGYDKAIVNYELNYHVDTITEEEDKIYITDKNNKLPICINEDDVYSAFDAGRKIELGNILPGDIISVSADLIDISKGELTTETRKNGVDDSSVFVLKRSEKIIEGKVTQFDDETISINDVEYKTAHDLYLTVDEIKLGESYTFYLNYLDEIADAECEDDSYEYAIMKAGEYGKGLKSKLTVRLFTKEGKFKNILLSDKLKLDGKKEAEYGNALDYLKNSSAEFSAQTGFPTISDGVWQLIRYVEKKEKITEIDTIRANKIVNDDDLTYVGKTAGDYGYQEAAKSYGGRFGVTADTAYFWVGSDLEDENEYSVVTALNTLGYHTMKGLFFDFNDVNVCGAVLRTDSDKGGSIAANDVSSMIIVQKIICKTNDKGVDCFYLCGTLVSTGAYKELELEEESVYQSKGIKIGDIVRVSSNNMNSNTFVEKMFSPNARDSVSTPKALLCKHGTTADPGYGFGQAIRLTYGKAIARDGNWLRVQYKADSELKTYDEPYYTEGCQRVLIWNSDERTLEESDIGGIHIAGQFGDADADYVLVYSSSNNVRTIVVYR